MGPREHKCVPFDQPWSVVWYKLVPIQPELKAQLLKSVKLAHWLRGNKRVAQGEKHSSTTDIEHNKSRTLIFWIFPHCYTFVFFLGTFFSLGVHNCTFEGTKSSGANLTYKKRYHMMYSILDAGACADFSPCGYIPSLSPCQCPFVQMDFYYFSNPGEGHLSHVGLCLIGIAWYM